MKHMIEGYRSYPGEHCGSVAMRGLLGHYCDLHLPEGVVFGLGSGVDCLYMNMPGIGIVAFGRTGSMEVDLATALGVGYEEAIEPDNDKAWQLVRDEVLAGRPTMLTGDIFYLDYREHKVHFPSHRFVLLGFDDEDERVFLADRIREEAETCSLGALIESRNPKGAISTLNLWGCFKDTKVVNDLVTASRIALERCALRMLGQDSAASAVDFEADDSGGMDRALANATRGIAGIKRFAEELPSWPDLPGIEGLASYNASAIEKFGNGGGNFRRLYAEFLTWAREHDQDRVPANAPALSTEAADGWTALAHLLWRASEGENIWAEASAQASRIAEIEKRLFTGLAEASA